MKTITVNELPKIGQILGGHTITEVRADGAVFGVAGPLPKSEIARLKKHFEGGGTGFCFRPGQKIAQYKVAAIKQPKTKAALWLRQFGIIVIDAMNVEGDAYGQTETTTTMEFIKRVGTVLTVGGFRFVRNKSPRKNTYTYSVYPADSIRKLGNLTFVGGGNDAHAHEMDFDIVNA